MSGIKGDWTIAKRADGTGGNLEVAGAARFTGSVSIEGTIELPGVIIDHHQHDAGDIITGTIDPARLPLATDETPGAVLPGNGLEAGETLTVKPKSGAGIGVDAGGVYLDPQTAPGVIGLKTAAYKDTAGNTGTSGDAGKIPVLGGNGKLDNAVIPRIAITETFTAVSDLAMCAIPGAERGDVCIRTDLNETFILAGDDPTVLANWELLPTPTDTVQSVNGKTGAVSLYVSDIYAAGDTKLGGTATEITGAAEDYSISTRRAVYDFARNASNLGTGTVPAGRLNFAVYGSTAGGNTETIVNPAYVTAAITALNLAGTYATISALNETAAGITETTATTYATKTELTTGYATIDHQHTLQPVDAIPASGIITLAKNKQQYKKAITGNTTIGFDATAIGGGNDKAITFELLLTTGTNTYNVLFGSNITWLNGDEPYFNTPNTSYLCAFRSYDGGANWVGAYQGQF